MLRASLVQRRRDDRQQMPGPAMAGHRVDYQAQRTLHRKPPRAPERQRLPLRRRTIWGYGGATGRCQGGAPLLHVQTATDSRAEAMELAHDAVQARLAACAQVAGPVSSTFWWDDAIEKAEE